jgi:serine/threonine protein kinase
MSLVGTVLENRYRLGEPIGVGGMGTVYLAEHVLLGESCAVKVLSPRFAFDPEWVKRFLLEGRAAIRIRHENVVQIKDFACPSPGLVYMVMEAISGESLADFLRREGPVPPVQALRIADYIASALEAAHGCGIIHRDIKPSNCIRTTMRGDPDFIKVLDFGIAKFTAMADECAHAPHTATGVWMGTAEYMAPEMYRGEPPDARVDIYALGVLLYKMLTGETPYKGNHIEVAVEQTQRAPVPPGQRAPDREIPREIDELVLRALARDLSSRTPTMAMLREEISAAIHGAVDASTIVRIDRDCEPTRIHKIRYDADPTPSPSATPLPAVGPTEPTALPAPAPRAPAARPVSPPSLPRSGTTQTELRRAVSARSPAVSPTEVTPSWRRGGSALLIVTTFSGLAVLTVLVWRITARTASEARGDEDLGAVVIAEADPNAVPPISASELDPVPAIVPAPVVTGPTPTETPTAPVSLSAVDGTGTSPLHNPEPPDAKRPVAKPRPHSKKKASEPPVEVLPIAITESEATRDFDRMQRECLSWGVPGGSTATLEITISAEGTATQKKIATSYEFFVDCLAKKLKETRFPLTQTGGRFKHAFTAR